jgi:ribonucleotide reductase alpha subunit
MKATPYNNGKVKIGDAVYLNKLANPPYIEQDEDMLELQSYLIQDPRVLNKEYWAKRIYVLILLFVFTVMLMAN